MPMAKPRSSGVPNKSGRLEARARSPDAIRGLSEAFPRIWLQNRDGEIEIVVGCAVRTAPSPALKSTACRNDKARHRRALWHYELGVQSADTSSACRPFWPWVTPNSTF